MSAEELQKSAQTKFGIQELNKITVSTAAFAIAPCLLLYCSVWLHTTSCLCYKVTDFASQVVPLENANLLDPELYPSFTLIGQAIGSVRLAFEALCELRPQVDFP